MVLNELHDQRGFACEDVYEYHRRHDVQIGGRTDRTRAQDGYSLFLEEVAGGGHDGGREEGRARRAAARQRMGGKRKWIPVSLFK